jgi:chromosome segregation protein
MLLVPEGGALGTGLAGLIPGSDVGQRALVKLVGQCTEVADLQTALAGHARDGGAYVVRRTEALPPVLLTQRGEIHVGPVTSGGTSVLQRRREIADLGASLPGLQAGARDALQAQSVAETAARDARAHWDAAQTVVTDARSALGEMQISHQSAAAELRQLSDDQQRHQQRLAALETERDGLSAELERLASSSTDISTSLESAMADQQQQETMLQALQVAAGDDERRFRDARQVAIVAATELAGVQERLQGLRRIEDTAQQAELGASRQVESCSRDIEAAHARIGSLATDDQRLNQALQEIGEEQGALRIRIEEEKAQVQALRDGLQQAEAAIGGLRDAREQATARCTDLAHQIDQVKAEIIRIRDQLDERYQVSVAALLDRLDRSGQLIIEVPEEAIGPEIDPEADPELQATAAKVEVPEDLIITPPMLEKEALLAEWIERLQIARSRLERLGEVNLVAVQEYTEVKERFDLLEAQRMDLEESVRAIRNSIAQLNRTCRERFRETFERVDVLFREGYPKLVGGGMARLVLTDQDDMLETGVDIEVQPPGKRLQNVSLLSGGEMAMAAISLIFALFRVKPSPFCLLDEVDAPLDEANGARFNGLLREMSALSQFIVITHNKKTMECVDTLYGVTMNNPGVSKLVTVKLD